MASWPAKPCGSSAAGEVAGSCQRFNITSVWCWLKQISAAVLLPTLNIQTFSPVLPQVGINIIEAQKLVGVNINPFVVVRVGEDKRHTATQKSTNCPFYNEVCAVDRGSTTQRWCRWPSARGALGAAALRRGQLWSPAGSPGLSCLSFPFQYFLFEFHEPREVLFHRLIEISVSTSSSQSLICNRYSLLLLCVDGGSCWQRKGNLCL